MLSYNQVLPSAILATVLSIARILWAFIYNIKYHPLSKFPGPKFAGASRLYESYFEALRKPKGQYIFEIDRLHKLYGPIVRINPNELHISDLDFSDTLYAVGAKRDKDPHHIQMFGTPLSLFGSELHDIHKARRSAINTFFSRASVLRLDPMVRYRVHQMCDKISDIGKRGQLVHLRDAFVAVTIDIVTEYSFSKAAGALDEQNLAPYWERMMSGVTEAVPVAKCLPGIVQLMQKLPLRLVRMINPLMGFFFDYSGLIRDQVVAICHQHHSRPDAASMVTKEKPSRTTVFHDLLESELPAHEKSEERLTQEGVGVVSAAAETTSTALAATMFHLLSDKDLVARLRSELNVVMPDPNVCAEWRVLETLPLLTAVVKEGLRISTPICGRLPLKSSEPLRFGDWTIPPHTSVSMSPRDALLDPVIFPNPMQYDPDRWLRDTSEDHKRQMNKAYIPFNKGPRKCLGFNLAYADVYHCVAALIVRFDMEIVDTLRSRDVDLVRDHFVAKPVRGSKSVRVRIVKELEAHKAEE